MGAGTTQGRRTQRCKSRRADKNETRLELGRISLWKLEGGEGNGQVDRSCWPFGSCADKCPRSPRGLLLLLLLLSQLRVCARAVCASLSSGPGLNGSSERLTGAGRGRTCMGEQLWPQLEVGERGQPGRRAPGSWQALGMDELVDNAAVCLSKWGGERETKGERGSELAGLKGWAFFVSNSLFDAGVFSDVTNRRCHCSSKTKGLAKKNWSMLMRFR